jgi:hypothetical protein
VRGGKARDSNQGGPRSNYKGRKAQNGKMSVYRRKQDAKTSWLNAFPGVRKFLNQCVICQELGYDPAKIKKKQGIHFQKNLKKFFRPLEINGIGICADCAKREDVNAVIGKISN